MAVTPNASRRYFLKGGVGIGVMLTGCAGGGTTLDGRPDRSDQPDGAGTVTPSPGTAEDEGATANYSIDHPIAAGAENDPLLGPPPSKAAAGIVLVSDPSCPYCREFDENVFDRLYENYIRSGDLSYVYRPYPKVRDWATTAAYAMLETWQRDESAWLPLKKFYYENSEELGAVLDLEGRTATFLNENTDVDGDAVAEAVGNFEQVDALTETADAVRAAEMTTIPSYAILRNGEVATTASGVQSYANLQRMLGVD